MNTNQFLMNAQMICGSHCPDKKRVSMGRDDAKRIAYRLEQYMGAFGVRQKRVRLSRDITFLFSSPTRSCSLTGGMCHKFELAKREKDQAEEELATVYQHFLHHLQTLHEEGNEEDVSRLKHMAFDLFRGHYPNAARHIERFNHSR